MPLALVFFGPMNGASEQVDTSPSPPKEFPNGSARGAKADASAGRARAESAWRPTWAAERLELAKGGRIKG